MRQRRSIDYVLLTGATGVLGARILKELLSVTDFQVFCLVRAEDPNQAKDRLLAFLSAYDPERLLIDEFLTRVTPVLGDVTRDNLGLSSDDYRELAEKVDATIHSAANTNLFSSFQRIEPINVGGTRNMIEFALATPQKNLCYVSTYTVMGDKYFDPSIEFTEGNLDIGQGFEDMTYQHTKYIAESLIHKAGERGLVWNIMRPGQIFGEAETGYYPQGQTNVSGLFYDIFKTVIETKVAGTAQAHFDVTPVDFVSRGIVYLGLKREEFYRTYHLTNPDVKRYGDIMALIRELGYELNLIPHSKYRELILKRALTYKGEEYKSATTKGFRWWFKREPFNFDASAVTTCHATRAVLAENGILCPRIDLHLLGTYIDDCIRKKYIEPAPRAVLAVPGRKVRNDEMVGLGQP